MRNDLLCGARICGIGYELGEELISNERISEIVEANVKAALGKSELGEEEKGTYCTYPEWIVLRTGIEQRYFASSETATSDLAAAAVRKAIDHSGRSVNDCQFILVATVTPDYPYSPPTASLVQEKIGLFTRDALGLKDCLVVDTTAACSSFAAALRLGYSLIASGLFDFGVIVGADKMSTTVDFSDRNFCILLGDAAAALALEAVSRTEDAFSYGSDSFFSWSDGSKGENIIARIGGSAKPITRGLLASNDRPPISEFKLWQAGRNVFKDMSRLLFSVTKPNETIIGRALARAGISLAAIDVAFFHQANLRIINEVEVEMRKAGFQGVVFNTISRFGNTTSASIPLGMVLAFEENVLRRGQTVLACAFGGGYTASTAIFRWTLGKI